MTALVSAGSGLRVDPVNGGLDPPDAGGLGWIWFPLLQRGSWLRFIRRGAQRILVTSGCGRA